MKRLILAMLCAAAQAAEVQDFVYVVTPPPNLANDAVQVVWIPAPVLKHCIGQTLQRCIDIDYCLRTANKTGKCAGLAPYPKTTIPNRVLSIVYYRAADFPGVRKLFAIYDAQPRSAFAQLSDAHRLPARIKHTRKPDDDDFDVLEIQ